MTLGRLLGDPFVERFGRVGTLQIGGALGVIGIALTTMGGLGWNTFVGFALVVAIAIDGGRPRRRRRVPNAACPSRRARPW